MGSIASVFTDPNEQALRRNQAVFTVSYDKWDEEIYVRLYGFSEVAAQSFSIEETEQIVELFKNALKKAKKQAKKKEGKK